MQPTGVIPSRLLSILRGVQIRGSSLICINIAVLWNSYGHPHEEVVERIKEAGCEIWGTAESGQVTIEITEEERITVCGFLGEKNLKKVLAFY